MISSLSVRLSAAVALVAIVAVVAVALAARARTHAAFIQFRAGEQDHQSRLAETHRRIGAVLDGRCCAAEVLHEAAQLVQPDSGLIVIGDGSDAVVATAGGSFDGVTSVDVERAGAALAIAVQRRTPGGSRRVRMSIPMPGQAVRLADGRAAHVHAVRLPTPAELDRIAAFYGSLDRALVAVTSLAGVFVVALAWIMGRRITKPLSTLSAASAALAHGDLARRVPAEGSAEIAALARSFNAMASELERQEMLRRHLVNDVTHELRTPLTAMRCRLEASIDGVTSDPARTVRELHDEVLHLSRLVDDLQELSLAESLGARLDVSSVDLPALVRSATRAAGLDGENRLRIVVPDTLRLPADPVRLRQILLNLLANAARHTPAEGTITVAARVASNEVILEVTNTGSTLDADQRRQVFDRFYRTDPARQRATGGAGLGLAIVKSLVEAHGGRVWVESDEGSVTFGVALPATA